VLSWISGIGGDDIFLSMYIHNVHIISIVIKHSLLNLSYFVYFFVCTTAFEFKYKTN